MVSHKVIERNDEFIHCYSPSIFSRVFLVDRSASQCYIKVTKVLNILYTDRVQKNCIFMNDLLKRLDHLIYERIIPLILLSSSN